MRLLENCVNTLIEQPHWKKATNETDNQKLDFRNLLWRVRVKRILNHFLWVLCVSVYEKRILHGKRIECAIKLNTNNGTSHYVSKQIEESVQTY